MKSNTHTVARPLQPGFSSLTLDMTPISTKTFLNKKCAGVSEQLQFKNPHPECVCYYFSEEEKYVTGT